MRDAPAMDRKTVAVYEDRTDEWIAQKHRPVPASLAPFAARVPDGMRADLGCGPGWYSGLLGEPVVALDAAFSMVGRVHEYAPHALRVQADLERLRSSLGQALRQPSPSGHSMESEHHGHE